MIQNWLRHHALVGYFALAFTISWGGEGDLLIMAMRGNIKILDRERLERAAASYGVVRTMRRRSGAGDPRALCHRLRYGRSPTPVLR